MTTTNFTSEPFAVYQNRQPTDSEFNDMVKKNVKYLFTDYWVYQKKMFDYFDPVFRFDIGTVEVNRIIRTHFPKEVIGKPDTRKIKTNWLDITDERVFKIISASIDAVLRRLTIAHKRWVPKIELVGTNGCNYDTGFEIDCRDQVSYNNRLVHWFRKKWHGVVAVEYEAIWSIECQNTDRLIFDALRIDNFLNEGIIDTYIYETTRPIFDVENCSNRIRAFLGKRLYKKWKKNHQNVNIVGINHKDGTNYFHI